MKNPSRAPIAVTALAAVLALNLFASDATPPDRIKPVLLNFGESNE